MNVDHKIFWKNAIWNNLYYQKIECQIPAKSIKLQVCFLRIWIISGRLGWADSSDLDSSQLIVSGDETNEIKFEWTQSRMS